MAPLFFVGFCISSSSRDQKLRPTRIRDEIMALVHCRECGEMISETAPTCPKCGANQRPSGSASSGSVDLDPSTGLNILSFLVPLVGLILYLVEKDKSPRRAKACGKWALIGFVVSIIFSIIIVVISGAAVASFASAY